MKRVYIDRPAWPKLPPWMMPPNPDAAACGALWDVYTRLKEAVPEGWTLEGEIGHEPGKAELTVRLVRQPAKDVVR